MKSNIASVHYWVWGGGFLLLRPYIEWAGEVIFRVVPLPLPSRASIYSFPGWPCFVPPILNEGMAGELRKNIPYPWPFRVIGRGRRLGAQ